VRALLKVALEPAGSRLVEAADGSAAVEAAWRERPDVVLLDVGLPKLSGIDVCRALKTSPRPPRVLLVTGNAEEPELDACGADGVVTKPFNPAELLATLRRELDLAVSRGA
jgi:CheY-like chemotaxis protein